VTTTDGTTTDGTTVPHEPAPGPGHPQSGRRGAGGPQQASAGQLLVTVLGDYWYGTTEHIPSAALVAIMAEFGVSEDAVRAALSRLCREGRLERVKDGRRTAYRLSPDARASADERGRRLMRYGAEPVPWDGMWTCVAFSVPESDRHLRSSFRNRLRSLGMGPLFDGFWLSPHPILDGVDRALDGLGIHSATVFRATEVPRVGGVAATDAWDLGALRADLLDFTASLVAVRRQVDDGAVGAAQALIARTDLMASWRMLAGSDPRLPDALLPDDWPLADARARFVAVYDALGPLSELRVRQLVGLGPDERGGPRHHRLARRA
jgi:phenylacetic acid degradation operon negative regulatory protein